MYARYKTSFNVLVNSNLQHPPGQPPGICHIKFSHQREKNFVK